MKREGLFRAENLRPIRFTGMELLTIGLWARFEEKMARESMQEDDEAGRPADPRLGYFKAGEKFDFYRRLVQEAQDIQGRIERHIDRCSWPGTVYAEA